MGDLIVAINAASSKGRTSDFDSDGVGSIPAAAASMRI